jgi:hypothetical protein
MVGARLRASRAGSHSPTSAVSRAEVLCATTGCRSADLPLPAPGARTAGADALAGHEHTIPTPDQVRGGSATFRQNPAIFAAPSWCLRPTRPGPPDVRTERHRLRSAYERRASGPGAALCPGATSFSRVRPAMWHSSTRADGRRTPGPTSLACSGAYVCSSARACTSPSARRCTCSSCASPLTLPTSTATAGSARWTADCAPLRLSRRARDPPCLGAARRTLAATVTADCDAVALEAGDTPH